MADKTITLRLNTQGAIQDLEPLRAKIGEIEASLLQITNTLGTPNEAPSARQDFFTNLQNLQAHKSAVASIMDSGITAGHGAVQAARAGASAGISPFLRDRSGQMQDANAVIDMMQPMMSQKAYIQTVADMGYNPQNYGISKPQYNQIIQSVVGLVQTAQNTGGAGGQPVSDITRTLQFTPQMQQQYAMPSAGGVRPYEPNNRTVMPAGGGNFPPAGNAMGGGGNFGGGGGGVYPWAWNNGGGGAPPSPLDVTQVMPPQKPNVPRYNRLTLQQAIDLGVGNLAVQTVGSYAEYQTSRTLEGGSGTAQAASMYAHVGAGILGLAAGALTMNPYAALGTMAAAEAALQPLGQYFVRDQISRENSQQAMGMFAGAYAGRPGMQAYLDRYLVGPTIQGDASKGGLMPQFTHEGISRFRAIMSYTNQSFDERGLSQFKTTEKAIAETFSNISTGLFVGGVDPEGPARRGADGISGFAGNDISDRAFALARSAWNQAGTTSKFPLIDTLIGNAGEAIGLANRQRYNFNPVSLAEMYTSRLSRIFGIDAPEAAKRMGAIFGSLPETGGNVADILSKFGAEDTSTYLAIQNPSLIPAIDPMALSRASASIRSSARGAAIGGLQARGSGAATQSALGRQMLTIAALPEGVDSLEFAQASAAYRAAGKTAFEQRETISFGVPMARLEGAIQRSDVLPFNPSNRFGLEMQVISRSEREVRKLQSFMGARRASGQLSEDEELELTQRIESLKTREAEGVARLSDRLDDRLPALTAGRPASFGRFDSFQLAAMSLWRQGSPIRGYGAISGAQKQMQEDFVTSFGAGNVGPYDRSMGMDNAMSGGMHNLTQALHELTNAIKSGGIGHQRGPTTNQQSAGGPSYSGSARDPGYPSDYRNATTTSTSLNNQNRLPSNSRVNTGNVN